MIFTDTQNRLDYLSNSIRRTFHLPTPLTLNAFLEAVTPIGCGCYPNIDITDTTFEIYPEKNFICFHYNPNVSERKNLYQLVHNLVTIVIAHTTPENTFSKEPIRRPIGIELPQETLIDALTAYVLMPIEPFVLKTNEYTNQETRNVSYQQLSEYFHVCPNLVIKHGELLGLFQVELI